MGIELKGISAAKDIQNELKKEIDALRCLGYLPFLSVILVGDDPGSVWYAQSKAKLGNKLGIKVEVLRFPEYISEEELINHIKGMNEDPLVHGILIELPLPREIDKLRILNAIKPVKDVDGVTAVNRGYVLGGQEKLALVPATPMACIRLIELSGVGLKGRRITLVGRGDTVGRPLASMLISRDATVTVCHTKTANLTEECRRADILIAAAGRKHLITSDMVSEGVVIIDAGVNELEDGGFTGDVHFESVKEKAAAITPVPGGVGSLTTTIIMANTVMALKKQKGLGYIF